MSALIGLAAGGNAGNASPVAPPLIALEAGLDTGGVCLVETGFDIAGELREFEALAQGVAFPRPAVDRLLDADAPVAGGRSGNATLAEWLSVAVDVPDGLPELNERRDCAVDDFSFSILELF